MAAVTGRMMRSRPLDFPPRASCFSLGENFRARRSGSLARCIHGEQEIAFEEPAIAVLFRGCHARSAGVERLHREPELDCRDLEREERLDQIGRASCRERV